MSDFATGPGAEESSKHPANDEQDERDQEAQLPDLDATAGETERDGATGQDT
ncbi:MAG: hypothetical protein ACTHMW_14460 [Actinomycetes bacterium]